MTAARRASTRAAAILAAAALLAPGRAPAHGPGEPHPRAAVPVPSGPLASPAARHPADDPGRGVVATTGVRPLRVLAAEAVAVVVGTVSRREAYDEDRVRLYRLRVGRALRGRLDQAEPGVVEVRGGSVRAPVLAEGTEAVVLLAPAPRLTYLVAQLPAGDHFVPAGGRDGVVPVASDVELAAVERALADGGAIAGLAPDEASEAARRLAFSELGGPSPRLAADALVELRRLRTLGPLAPAEGDTIRRALGDRRVDATTRIGLIDLVGARGEPRDVAALAGVEVDDPAVLGAWLAARARLGAPAGRSELAPWLAAEDPAVRAAAVRALARVADPAALADVGRRATTDPDTAVRAAAIEALGASGQAAAVPVLARTFEGPENEIRQKSAQALLAIGGTAADDALVELALRGASGDTQRYAALLLIVTRGRDHPAVRRIEQAGPGPEVRELLEHGLEFRHSHQH